jgi:hypothetical protein
MHPTPQGVTLDIEQYDKLKYVDKVLPTLLSELKKPATLSVYTSKRRGSYVIHGWFPVMPFHYIACCPLRYIPKTTNVTFDGMCREGRYG